MNLMNKFLSMRLRWKGSVSVPDVEAAFGLSKAQASRNLRTWIESIAGAIPKLNRRTYGAHEFEKYNKNVPIESGAGLLRFLEAQRVEAVLLERSNYWFSDVGFEAVDLDLPLRIDDGTVKGIVQGLTSRSAIRFDYISRSTTSMRTVSPTGLVSYSSRFYLRGYDHSDDTFKLFMVSRMFGLQMVPDSFISQRDTKWGRGPLTLRINPSLPDHVRIRLEEEWETSNGKMIINARKCLHGLIVADKTQDKKVMVDGVTEYMSYWLVEE